MTNSEVKNILLNSIKTKYESGKFWNHAATAANDPTSVTNIPCSHHGKSCETFDGSCGCNSFANAIQCHGFALYVASMVFSNYPVIPKEDDYETQGNGEICQNGWILYSQPYCSNLSLEPGDIVRVESGTEMHTALVWYVEDTTRLVKVVEVWGGKDCKIAWGNYNGSSLNTESRLQGAAKYIIKAPKELSISYNLNGGSWSRENNERLNMNLGTVTLTGAKPAREGYVFEGWECSVDGNVYTENANISGLWNLDSMTLTARWVPNFVTVSLSASNGLPVGVTPNISENSLTVNFDSTLSSDSLPVPDCNGRYDFVGWYADSACTVSANGYKVETTGTLTLYAKWTCFVRIEAGATGMSGYPLEITGLAIGAQFELPVTVPVHPDGWYFKGYDCSYNGERYYHGENVTITENTVFYITWEEPCVYLSFEGGGSIAPMKITKSSLEEAGHPGDKIPCSMLPNVDEDNEHMITAWRIKGDTSGTVYLPDDGSAYLPEFRSYVLEKASIATVIGTLTYDANGGAGGPAAQYIRGGVDNFITKDIPVREDHHFHGWAESADSITPVYTPGSLYNGTSATLYAVWIGGCYVLRFDTGASTNDDTPVYGIPMPVTYVYFAYSYPRTACGAYLSPEKDADKRGYHNQDMTKQKTEERALFRFVL